LIQVKLRRSEWHIVQESSRIRISRSLMSDGISRRKFLKGTGAVITGVAMLDQGIPSAESATASGTKGAEPGGRRILLHVNGMNRAVQVEPQMTLAEVLRGPLELTGTKIGCDRGACSACTVWIDGTLILSCMTLALDVGERKVVTIEGLARSEDLHPVQSAFIAHDAIQCGFCTPGLVMTCAALLEKNRDPSRDEVKAAVAGHLCRCGTIPHVIDATLDAAKAMKG
jgi:aerobic-type carbon monoxide dehydrogenase small subunit (CoxS/CutS family)